MRECGVLLPVYSLPGPGGCGTMGLRAHGFVDFLAAAGQRWWQVLPLAPPARGNSPYSAYSVFAGNPALIDLELLAEAGLLPGDALAGMPAGGGRADYGWCATRQMELLRESFRFAGEGQRQRVAAFRRKNRYWLPGYALFMALKGRYNGAPCSDWPAEIRRREPLAMEEAAAGLAEEVAFWEYVQLLFFHQWRALRRHAARRGVRIMGDMPFYVDVDSADVWAHPQDFLLDGQGLPARLAGVPPDAFSEDGQLWGNPLYDWDSLRRSGYRWWMERLGSAGQLYDAVRIDHFRALSAYWSVPAGADTAIGGRWEKGPGMHFIRKAKRAVPGLELIAEDLGMLDDGVRRLLKKSGLPGMKVLLFAFDPGADSDYLPHNFAENCVGYIGTHDNDTVMGWMKDGPKGEVGYARRYLRLGGEDAHWDWASALYATPARLVVVQMQDLLGLDNSARTNIPGVPESNWAWRMEEGCLTRELARKTRSLAALYGRMKP